LNAKALGLSKPTAPVPDPKPGEILVGTRLHEVADESLKAITPHVFQRNGVLCEVVRTNRVFIHDLEPAGIVDLMSRHATYLRPDDNKGAMTTSAPAPIAGILHARRIHPKVRILEAITTAPVFLADGSILESRGYNEQARMWLEPSVDVYVPEEPELKDARQAVALFEDLLCDFKFHAREDFSAWLAGVLSPLCKAAIDNAPVPLICVSAASPGVGKTLLTDLIARIVTGGKSEIRPYNPKDPGEWGKRVTAFVRAGTPVNVFDNINGTFGDETIDRLITASTWSDRVLGASEAPPMPIVGVWYATGNNIEPINDTVRRTLMCRVEVDTERPQERTDFKRPLLEDYTQEHRAELLTAALTILRAYHVAGRPAQKLPAWGSFTAWSQLVRGALVWTGLPDPFLTQQRTARNANEPENDAHDFWISIINDSDGSPADIVFKANEKDVHTVLGMREHLTPLYLRRFVSRFVDKPRQGKRIRREGNRYHVEHIP
jgi:hypothetical protein